jgi:cation transport ATPase
MADKIEQTRQVNSDGTASVQTTEVVDNTNQKVDNTSLLARIIWFIGSVLAVLLAFRFVFILLGANSSNGFADFIYTISHPFAAPFFGIFGYTQVYGEAKFEVSTLLAIAVFLLVAYGLAKLVTIRRPKQ